MSYTKENCNYSYEHLNKDDTSFYYDLTPYKFYDKTIPLDLFKNLDLVLNRFSPNISLCEWDKNFRFIPEYDNNDVTKLTQIHRIVFFAICKYYKENGYNSTSMNRWMRVVWNLVSGDGPDGNPQIRDTQAIRTAIEFISELNSHSAYESLTKYSGELSDTSFDNRCKEEIAKAKQILDEYGKLRKYEGSCKKEDGTSYHTWEEIIVDAEKYAFFKGAIRFLFTDGEGNINWCDFDKKWSTIKKYFDKNGEIVEKYKTNAILLRALISRINIGENWFGYYKMFWHTSLLNSDYKNAIHYLLTTSQLVIEKSCGQDWIIHDSLLHELLCCYNSWHILTSWRGFNVLTRYSQRRSDATSNKEIVVLNDLRNRLLAHKDIVISQEKRVEGTTYLYGWNINFKYNEHFFQWYGPSNDIELDVYLMENDWKDYKKRPNPTENKDTDEDTYFCFRVDMSTTSDTFTDKLNKLIVQADADKQRL